MHLKSLQLKLRLKLPFRPKSTGISPVRLARRKRYQRRSVRLNARGLLTRGRYT